MGIQLNIFKEAQKTAYQKYYDEFYKGVKERWAKKMEDEKPTDEMIYIYPIKIK